MTAREHGGRGAGEPSRALSALAVALGVAAIGCTAAASPVPSPAAAPPRLASPGGPVPVSAAPRRFLLSGDGALELDGAHDGRRLRVRYRDGDGAYDPAALARIDDFFRSRGDASTTRVSLRLVEAIDFVQDRARPSATRLQSGYRSGEYNAAIIRRGANASRASMHTEGLAADLAFLGVDQRALWQDIRSLECCGAGWYASSGFIHLDVGRPRFWEETTSRVKENLSRGNARIIARTDFDRYDALDGAVVGLHAVTLRPLRIARRAEFLPQSGDGRGAVALRLSAPEAREEGGCLDFPDGDGAPPIRLAVAEETATGGASPPTPAAPVAAPIRGRIVLHACPPRLEATPAEIETNPVEIRATVAPAPAAARGRS